MVKVELENQYMSSVAMFRRGSDIEELMIYKKMSSVRNSVWTINDFKINKRRTRNILEKLTRKGYIEKMKGYPTFWRVTWRLHSKNGTVYETVIE